MRIDSDKMDLNKLIKDKAYALGIDLCGITDYKLDRDRVDWLRERKIKAYETEFEEEDLSLRLKPELTMENCRSIIVIALSYNIREEGGVDYRFPGRLSKSSWGIDYHQVLKVKMEELVSSISEDLDFEYKIFVDTGPLIDRELAEQAGIGYFGKNCSIINDELGSFLFIGYIMTDLRIENDSRLEKDCGDCRKCIDACPTGALEEYRVNPKLCLSYLSQTKEEIPEELIAKLSNRIYGCDNCQLVCPRNKDAKISSHKEFIPYAKGGYLDIEKLMGLSNREFKEEFGHKAGAWRGRNLWKRNGIIALHNSRDPGAVSLIEAEKDNPSQLIRDYARWSLSKK